MTEIEPPPELPQRAPKIKYGIISLLLLVGIGVGMLLLRKNLDTRNKAVSSSGTANFTFTLVAPGRVQIAAVGTGQSLIDGFQLIADLSGTVPSDMSVVPTAPSGLTPVATSLTDTSGGKRLTFAFVTSNPTSPFQANNTSVPLGTLVFTPPVTGSLTITPDQFTTKILQSSTGVDLMAPSYPMTISIGTATATPIATTPPTPTGTVTPVPSPTPAPQGGAVLYHITSGKRDANEDNKRVTSNQKTIWIGNGSVSSSYTAFQFTTTMSPGTKIASAWLELYSPKTQSGPVQFEAQGLIPTGTNHTAVFSSKQLPSNRLRTTANTLYSTNETTPAGTSVQVDVTSIVQELVNSPDFGKDSDKIMAFILRGTGAQSARKYMSAFEGGASHAATLRITLQ